MDLIDSLSDWYKDRCDGDWEHVKRFVETLI